MQGDILTIEEACSLVNCKSCTLVSRLRSGSLPGTKIGRSWVIPRQAFVERLNQLAVKGQPKVTQGPPRGGRRRPLVAV